MSKKEDREDMMRELPEAYTGRDVFSVKAMELGEEMEINVRK